MSFLFRAYYGWAGRKPLTNSTGVDTSVLYTYAHMLLSMLEVRPTHVTVCFDAKGKTFRHEMFTDYKANRPPTPPALVALIPEVAKLVRAMGISLMQVSGVEADDIIGTLARRAVEEEGMEVSIASSDKDFFQASFLFFKPV